MTITFQKAARGNFGLLLMLSGGTGSGKTWSAMELAKGLAGDKRFAVCDTERGRASLYADRFDFDSFELEPPFSPARYLEVAKAAEAKDYPVLVIDSMSHEWEGPGGMLERHDELMGGNQSKNLSAWIEPKREHRRLVNHLLQAKPHIIMCFRAAEKVEAVRKDGKMQIVPKRSLVGLDGWLPITEKNLPFEATASFMLLADRPGVPNAIKLPDPLRPLVPLDQPLSEEVGADLARWAAGATNGSSSKKEQEAAELSTELLQVGELLGKRDVLATAIANNRRALDPAKHVTWLKRQLKNASAKLDEQASDATEDVAL